MSPVAASSSAPASATPNGDDALAALIAAGEAGAFETLFKAYYNPLCVFAERYVRSAAIAEELVEDTFFWLWEHRADWQVKPGGVKPYLYRAVRNRALRQLARGQVASREQEIAAL